MTVSTKSRVGTPGEHTALDLRFEEDKPFEFDPNYLNTGDRVVFVFVRRKRGKVFFLRGEGLGTAIMQKKLPGTSRMTYERMKQYLGDLLGPHGCDIHDYTMFGHNSDIPIFQVDVPV